MSELSSEAMESEFGTVAGWTEQAVAALGPGYAVPAGCRGSGSEAALRWLADELAVRPGERVLDAGAGVGGPAGWLAAERGVRPVCA
ncbi:MAG: Methyltransferase type 11, S-adenosyl-L-methionine-dependent, partial [Modestobacter sp.]|nr:Methyltransferase type 11, S-adenosyl-L-methionine-dependent [Modestobacter sp.]